VQTVVETPTYLSAAEKLFSEEERADIVLTVAADPEYGEVMKGTGGFRKFRVARGGKGKSGGARVIYIQRDNTVPVVLIAVFRKTRKRTSRRLKEMLLKNVPIQFLKITAGDRL